MDATVKRELDIDSFITLFLVALVLRGKERVYIRRGKGATERRRMYALHEYLCKKVETDGRKDREWFRFIVRLRNALSPGNIGFFESFYYEIKMKQLTIVTLDWPDCEYYELDLQPVTAQCYWDRAHPQLQELVAKSADVYMKAVEGR